MEDNISKRRGKILLNREHLLACNAKMLKSIFSEFYPMAIEVNHNSATFYDTVIYFGLSPQFELIDATEVIPEYVITITSTPEGDFTAKFEKE